MSLRLFEGRTLFMFTQVIWLRCIDKRVEAMTDRRWPTHNNNNSLWNETAELEKPPSALESRIIMRRSQVPSYQLSLQRQGIQTHQTTFAMEREIQFVHHHHQDNSCYICHGSWKPICQ